VGSFNYLAARQAGYSEEEIGRFLANEYSFDYDAAVAEGYKPQQIVDFLSIRAPEPLAAPEVEDKRTVGNAVQDLAASFGVGTGQLVGLLGSAYGLTTGDMDNRATRFGANTAEFWEARKTPILKAAEDLRQARIDAADGELEKAGVAIWETVKNPMLFISEVTKQVPNLAVGGLAGIGAKTVGKVGAAALGKELSEQAVTKIGVTAATGSELGLSSADFGQSAYEQLMAIPDEVWAANPDLQERTGGNPDLFFRVKREMATELAQNSAIAGGIVTFGLNKLPGAKTIEKVLGGDALTGTRLRRAATGLAGETVSEGLEEGATQLSANIAQAQIDPNTDLTAGLGQAAGLGAVVGGAFGAGAGALAPQRAEADPSGLAGLSVGQTTTINGNTVSRTRSGFDIITASGNTVQTDLTGANSILNRGETLKFGESAPAPAPTEVTPEQAIGFGQDRLRELQAKRDGTPETETVDPVTGQRVIVPGRLSEFITDSEKAELAFLENDGGNAFSVAKAYNLKIKVAAEQKLKEATNAGDAISAAEEIIDGFDADIEALEREVGMASVDLAPIDAITPAPIDAITPAPLETLQSGRGLLAQEMTGTASVTLPPVEPKPTLTLEALASADISSMPAPERQEFLADLNFARTAQLPAQRQAALTRAAETYGRTVGPIQQPVARPTPEQAIQAARQPTAERLATAAPDIDALLGADTRALDQEDRADFNAQLAMARTAEPGPVQTAALNRAAEIYGRAIGPIQPRAQAIATERVTTAAPDMDALLTADTRALPLEDRADFNAQLAMARTTEPGPAQTAALNRAAEIYGRAIGPIQPRTQTATSVRTETPRPSRLLGRATESYSTPELQTLADNTKLPEITRRGAQIELSARANFASSFKPTMTPLEAPTNVQAFREAPVALQQGSAASLPNPAVSVPSRAAEKRAAFQPILDSVLRAGDPKITLGTPAPEAEAQIQEMGDILGSAFGQDLPVVAFSDPSPESPNGFTLSGQAFVNVSGLQASAPRTALHEFKHVVEQIAAAEAAAGFTDTAAQEFTEQIDSIFDDMTEDGKRSYVENFLFSAELEGLTGAERETRIQELLVDPLLRSEMTADFLGNRAQDKKFWTDLAAADPQGFTGFVQRWLAVVDNLLTKLRGAKNQKTKESARVDKYINDLNKAKLTAQSALINYRKASGQAPVAVTGATPQFSRQQGDSLAETASLAGANRLSSSQTWRKGRDLKVALQQRVIDAAAADGIDVSTDSPETREYLLEVGMKDALAALNQNPNAIGWYDIKTRQALAVMSLVHPEIARDENARFAFTWALAVTSNGMKVDQNFELAEKVYDRYKREGVMPSNVGTGTAANAINKSLAMFNELRDAWGIDNLRQFMQTNFTVSEITGLSKDLTPGGEFASTTVKGAAILGPKIGNGFFSNLYGDFTSLTMDRWLIRTWGRWTGTLIKAMPEQTALARTRLSNNVKAIAANKQEATRLEALIDAKITADMDVDQLSALVQKASMDPKIRAKLNETELGTTLRLAGNSLAKYLDGQKEAPAGPEERQYIRSVFNDILDELNQTDQYKDLMMADLQAVLWYAEKRLYETAKDDPNQLAADEGVEGYDDESAPDYANAAARIARQKGVTDRRINATLKRIEDERSTAARSEDDVSQDTGAGQPAAVREFTRQEKRKFLGERAILRVRSNRAGDAQPSGSYAPKSEPDGGRVRVLKSLGVSYTQEWKVTRDAATAFRANKMPAPEFLELAATAENAERFTASISENKAAHPFGAAVYVYPAEEYQGMRLFLTKDGKSGVAIKPDGDIVSVFSTGGAGRSVMELAVAAGGRKLDAFDTILPEFYAPHGFRAVARTKWNDEFAPSEWDKDTFSTYNNGEPDVVFMVYDPSKMDAEYSSKDGRVLDDYDRAVALQNREMKRLTPKFSRKQGDVLARDPRLEQAAQGLKEGTVTSAEYSELVDAIKPVTPYTEVPNPAKLADIQRALTSDKLDRIGVPSKTLKAGDPVGLRLDIPAYANHGVWVVSVHDQIPGFAAGKSIGYESVASVTNPTFGVVESAALNIASGKPKATIAVMKGDWKPISPKQASATAKLAMASKNWAQVGMDPTRHAYFYDRATLQPVVSADEAIQVGPLVLAKNPVYGNKEDFRFSRKQADDTDEPVRIRLGRTDNTAANKALDSLQAKLAANPLNDRELTRKGAAVNLSVDNGALRISDIRSTSPGQGEASELLDMVIAEADTAGTRVTLFADSYVEDGGLNTDALVDWYSRRGFEEVRRDEDGVEMRRYPANLQFSRKQGGDEVADIRDAREERNLRMFSQDLRSRISDSVKTRAENTRKVDAEGGFLGLEVGDTFLTQGAGGRRWRNKVIAKSLSRVGPSMRRPTGNLNPISSEFEYTFDDTVYTPAVYVETIGPDGDVSQSTNLLYLLDQTGYTKMGGPKFSRKQTDTPDIRFSLKQQPFYSSLKRAVGDMPERMRTQPAKQWIQWLTSPSNQSRFGFKKDEVSWSGVEDYLNLRGKDKVTADDIIQYLNENNVVVQDVVLGGPPVEEGVYPEGTFMLPESGEVNDRAYWREEMQRIAEEEELDVDTLMDELVDVSGEPIPVDAPEDSVQYGGYTAGRGERYQAGAKENYREVLITLPYKGGKVSGEVKFISESLAEEFMEELSMQGLDKLDYGADTSDRSLVVYENLTEAQYDAFATVRDLWPGKSTMTVMKTGGDLKQKGYMSSHWDAPNVLAHLRVEDRSTTAGDPVLFVNEVQSDWGQEAREKGIKQPFTMDELLSQRVAAARKLRDKVRPLNLYDPARDNIENIINRDSANNAELKTLLATKGVTSPDTVSEVITLATEYRDAKAAVAARSGKPDGTISDAPFIGDTESWVTLALKRAVIMAVDGNYDKLAFVNGEQAADMFNLSKRVGEILYNEGAGLYSLTIYSPDGDLIHRENNASADEVANLVGKDLANKIVNGEGTYDDNYGARVLSGLDLKVGGEGMVGFYDGIVPNILRKLAKKFGGSVAVEPIRIESNNTAPEQLTLTITDDLRKQVEGVGLPLFSRKQNIFGQPLPASNWSVEDGKMDDAIYSMQDKLVDTKRVLQGIRKAGNTIADRWDGYLQETLYHGRTATRTTDFIDDELSPLIKGMGAANVSMKEFDTYLHNRHAQERNAAIAQRNPALPDAGSGIKSGDARAYLAAMDPNRRATLEALAQKVDAITEKTRQALLAGGLESQAAIDAWEATYSQYVPLMREELDFDPSGGSGGSGAGFSVKGSSSRRAVGSSSRAVVDILANIAMQRERAIVRAEKNRVSQAMYGLAIQNPNPGFWLPINPDAIKDKTALAAELVSMGINPLQAQNIAEQPKQSYVDPRSGLVTTRINSFLADNPNVLVTRVNGKDRFLLFNSQDERANRMVKALKNLDADQLGRAMSMAAVGTRWFASVNTQYNPIFGLINFARDVQGGMLNLSTTQIAGKQKDVAKNTVPALIGIYRDLRSGTPSQWATLWEDFQQAGGQTGFRDQFSQSEERGNALQKELDALRDGSAKKAGKAVLNWLSDYNTAFENAVRLSAYKVALDNGVSKEQAASLAKNLTVNFNKKGQIATQMGALYAFFNASVQGSARLLEALKGPAGKKIVYGGLLLGSAQALAMAAAGFDEDEPPQFLRERNIIIPIGDKKYLAVPMPLGFNVIPNTGRVVTEWAMSGFENTGARMFDLLGSFVDMFNPIGNAGFSGQTIAPTLADPFVALFENRDWSGNPIAKENFNSLAPTPGYTRAKDTASLLSKELSYYLNLASGGTEFAPGALSPTPDQIDYLFGQITGGLGREIMKTEQTATALITGEDLPPFKIPLFGRLYGDTSTSAADANRFYENIRRMNIHKEEIDGRQESRRPVGEYLRENPEARLVTAASSTYREVQQMRNRKREMVERGASRESVRIMEQRIASRMRQFNDRLDRM
jgi:hypothetical protein